MKRLTEQVLEHAEQLPEGTPLTAKGLLRFGTCAAVDQVLSRLAKPYRTGHLLMSDQEQIRYALTFGRAGNQGTGGARGRNHCSQWWDGSQLVKAHNTDTDSLWLLDFRTQPNADIRQADGRIAICAILETRLRQPPCGKGHSRLGLARGPSMPKKGSTNQKRRFPAIEFEKNGGGCPSTSDLAGPDHHPSR